jgi:ribosomal protein S18 acetylase RimI-like enzyme
MIDIRALSVLDSADLVRVATGYSSGHRYLVTYADKQDHVSFDLQLVALATPYIKQYRFDEEALEEWLQECRRVLSRGYSVGAFADGMLVGLLIAEPQVWQQSLCVREFHVAETHRRLGIGQRLIDSTTERARHEGFRVLVCETQTTNAPAISFYRRLGFLLEGIDISYYTNQDYPAGEIAVFMKKRL